MVAEGMLSGDKPGERVGSAHVCGIGADMSGMLPITWGNTDSLAGIIPRSLGSINFSDASDVERTSSMVSSRLTLF